jgi:hypothetical protein
MSWKIASVGNSAATVAAAAAVAEWMRASRRATSAAKPGSAWPSRSRSFHDAWSSGGSHSMASAPVAASWPSRAGTDPGAASPARRIQRAS